MNANPPETLVRLADVPNLRWLPRRRGDRALALSTVHRWASAGIRGIRLETVRVGACLCTDQSKLHAFFAALADPDWARTRTPTTPRRRERAIVAAIDQLSAAGI